jgi:hypothetical protein
VGGEVPVVVVVPGVVVVVDPGTVVAAAGVTLPRTEVRVGVGVAVIDRAAAAFPAVIPAAGTGVAATG